MGLTKNKFSIILIAFFTCQVIIDLAGSISMFPFLHAGMYSESYKKPDSLQVFEITVDGKKLTAGDFRIHVWDMIHQPLNAFQKQTATNDFAKEKASIANAGIKAFATNLNNDTALPAKFPTWYKHYVEGIMGKDIHSLQVDQVSYRYENGGLQQLSSVKWINQ